MLILGLPTALELINLAFIGIGPGTGDSVRKRGIDVPCSDGVDRSNVIVRKGYEKIVGQTAFHAYLSDWVRRHCVVRGQLTARPRPDAARYEWIRPPWVIDLYFVYLFPIELGNRFNGIETS